MVCIIVIKQISFVNFEKLLTMAKFKIDDIEYDTDKLDNKQKGLSHYIRRLCKRSRSNRVQKLRGLVELKLAEN